MITITETEALNTNKKDTGKNVVIKADKLRKIYKLPSEEIVALKGIDLEIKKGEFVSLMGPSGSGKSTLFNLIGCLDSVTDGSLYVMDYEVSKMKEEHLPKVRRGNIGFVFQEFFLIPSLTALENVEMPYIFSPQKGSREKALALLDLVGLSHRINHLPKEMSGGEMQRVAIARALACNPKILLADEPARNLDTKNARAIFQLFRELCKEKGLTVVVATHNVALACEADRVIRLKNGLIDEIGEKNKLPQIQGGREQKDSPESSKEDKIIKAHELRKNYRRGSETVKALNGVDFSISPGEIVSIVGPSGSGKTTLMNLISCMDTATTGELRIGDTDVTPLRENRLINIRRENIGFVFQGFHLIPTLTVRENMELPLLFSRKKIDREKIVNLLDMVGLKDKENKYPFMLSGGEQQRVAIARAMVNDPNVLLADEPTGKLDIKLRDEIMNIFRKLAKEKHVAVFIATHDLELAALTDRVIHFQDGQVIPESQSTLYLN